MKWIIFIAAMITLDTVVFSKIRIHHHGEIIKLTIIKHVSNSCNH